jgi:ribosomal protein S6
MSGKFDHTRHKLVAIDADGQHLHVTFQELQQAERETERAASFQPEVARFLQLILERLDEFDQRLTIIEQVKVQLVQGVVG